MTTQVERVAEAIARAYARSLHNYHVDGWLWPRDFSEDAVKRYREMAVAAIAVHEGEVRAQ